MNKKYEDLYMEKAREHSLSIYREIVKAMTESGVEQFALIEDYGAAIRKARQSRDEFVVDTIENIHAKLREKLKDPRVEAEARRYLLVNGWIPYTPKNVKGLEEFYIAAEHLPRRIRSETLRKAFSPEGLLDVTDAEVDAEEEIRAYGIGRAKLEGAWIKDGKPNGFKVYVERTVRLGTTFNFPSDESP